jgi:hypothetical protein
VKREVVTACPNLWVTQPAQQAGHLLKLPSGQSGRVQPSLLPNRQTPLSIHISVKISELALPLSLTKLFQDIKILNCLSGLLYHASITFISFGLTKKNPILIAVFIAGQFLINVTINKYLC